MVMLKAKDAKITIGGFQVEGFVDEWVTQPKESAVTKVTAATFHKIRKGHAYNSWRGEARITSGPRAGETFEIVVEEEFEETPHSYMRLPTTWSYSAY